MGEHGEMGKRCTGCGEELPVEAFGWKDRRRGLRQSRCKACLRAYQREWYMANGDRLRERARDARRRRRRLNAPIIGQAKAVPCADCGERFTSEEMDFDHVRGEKRFNIGDAHQRVSVERLLEEMAKCEVVCAVCHRIRTARRARP